MQWYRQEELPRAAPPFPHQYSKPPKCGVSKNDADNDVSNILLKLSPKFGSTPPPSPTYINCHDIGDS